MKNQLLALQNELHNGLVGRLEIIKSALLALLAGENMVLVGPPGTGKSMVARRIAEALKPKGAHHYFEYLLTKFSTPEELFGPLSISALKQDCFQRNTDGYLPTVQVAFLDEIFKANSSILNALLTVLNERKFHNGTKVLSIPLQTLIAASNELPTGQEELAALYDRFLLRRFVGYLSPQEQEGLFRLPENTAINTEHLLSTEAIADIRQQAAQVDIPQHIQQAIMQIWEKHQQEFKENADEQLSDRRFVKALHLLRISSATNGRNAVDLSDILLLKDCLWNNAENADQVYHLVLNTLKCFDQMVEIETNKTFPSHNILPVVVGSKLGIDGYSGTGSQQDPILIDHIQHLQGLDREEVGQQGYYFRQTADIDGTGLSTWLNIQEFQGHYDGGGYSINYNNKEKALFQNLSQSTIHHLSVNELKIAKNIIKSTIYHCQSSHRLTEDVQESVLFACQSGWNLTNNINNTIVRCCRVGFLVASDEARESRIEDCLVSANFNTSAPKEGLITSTLSNSQVVNCWVEGSVARQKNHSENVWVSGITGVCENSKITGCALGVLESTNGARIQRRIAHETDNKSILRNNTSTDKNSKNSDGDAFVSNKDGQDGASETHDLLNEYYLKHTLKWNFNTVWQWNEEEKKPRLQKQGDCPTDIAPPTLMEGQESLLAQQMRNNIWL